MGMEFRDRLVKWLAELPVSRVSQGTFWLLVILCCQQLATLTWQLVPVRPGPVLPLQPQMGSRPAVAANPLDVRSLLQLALFGKVPVVAKTPVTPTTPQGALNRNAPRTRLNLTLTGVLASTVPSRSIAVIIQAGQEASYGIGETISGTNAKLRDILPDRVILNNQGQDETLMLDGEEFKSNVPGAAPPRAPSQSSALSQLRDDLVKDPGKLLDYITISPAMQDGKLQGYRINPGKDVAFFHRLGLQSNDLAISINGNDLRDNAQAMQIMNQLSSMTEMNLTVERNGLSQDIYIKLTE